MNLPQARAGNVEFNVQAFAIGSLEQVSLHRHGGHERILAVERSVKGAKVSLRVDGGVEEIESKTYGLCRT